MGSKSSGVRKGVVGQEDGGSKHLGHRGLAVKERPAIKGVWSTARMWGDELKFSLWDSPARIIPAHRWWWDCGGFLEMQAHDHTRVSQQGPWAFGRCHSQPWWRADRPFNAYETVLCFLSMMLWNRRYYSLLLLQGRKLKTRRAWAQSQEESLC